LIAASASMPEVIHSMNEGRLGLCIVDNGRGIITDGDLRRHMEQDLAGLMSKTAADIMGTHPKTIDSGATLSQAEELMNHHKITSLLVTENGQLAGVIQIYDLNS
jgi:arabinose-5-phosphate isomerase